MPSTRGASHVALTVRDMEASAAWYQRVFGWIELQRLAAHEAGTPRIVLFDPSSGFALTVCRPEDGQDEGFDHRRTGLDHLAFGVADEAELDRWLAHLDDNGIAHSPVRDIGLGKLVSFEDPDGIQLELWVNASA
ncbi:MAG TPA: VOC family protein [Acidimicrobiales bacterium]|nr:VOC family protein [Acidimicrobiales bacterium]